jgi:hypothetical protein
VTEPLTQQQIAGRLGALRRWAKASGEQRAAQGRRGQEGLRDRFRREIRESGETDPAEIERRMGYLLREHYIRMRMGRRRRGAAA